MPPRSMSGLGATDATSPAKSERLRSTYASSRDPGGLPLLGTDSGSSPGAASPHHLQVLAARKAAARSAGITYIANPADGPSVLPRRLPRGLAYAAHFAPFEDVAAAARGSSADVVRLSPGDVAALFRAKCVDQQLLPAPEREARFLALVAQHCRGSRFALTDCGLGAQAAAAIASTLAPTAADDEQGWGGFSELVLDGNNLRDDGAAHVAALLAHPSSHIVLASLRSNAIGAAGGAQLAAALAANTALTALDLAGSAGVARNHLGARGAAAFGAAMRSNQCLAVLRLRCNGLGRAGCAAICSGLVEHSALTELDLGGNNIGPEGAAAVAELLGSAACRLQALLLDGNGIGDAGAAAVAAALKSPKPAAQHLTALDVADNGIRAIGARHVADALRCSKVVRAATLSGNAIGDTGGHDVAVAVRDSKALTSLALARCGLQSASGRYLGEALATAGAAITRLDLADNELGEEGAKALAGALAGVLARDASRLTVLDFGSNRIGDAGGAAFAAVIGAGGSLTSLSLRLNGIAGSAEALAAAAKRNTALLSLDFALNSVSYKAYAALTAALAANNERHRATAGVRLRAQIAALKRGRGCAEGDGGVDLGGGACARGCAGAGAGEARGPSGRRLRSSAQTSPTSRRS